MRKVKINDVYNRVKNALVNYPNCRDTIGISDIKNGSQYYELIARQFTTTELTPDEIHNIGLSEVSRIKNEMFKVMDQVQWNGSFDEFLKTVKNKNLSPRLKKLKKTILIKSPFQKKAVQSKSA